MDGRAGDDECGEVLSGARELRTRLSKWFASYTITPENFWQTADLYGVVETREINLKTRKWTRLRRLTWSTLVGVVILGVTVAWVLRKPRDIYWSGKTYSLNLQTLTSGAFSENGFWIRSGWDGPTGEFTHGELYGLKFGKRLLRLDVVHDPVAAIKRQLPADVPGLLRALASNDFLVKNCAGEALIRMGEAARSAIPALLEHYEQGDETADWVIPGLAKTADASAVPYLIDGLAKANPKVRRKVAEALGEIGDHASPAVAKLTATLRDQEPNTAISAALALRKIELGDHGEVSVLIGLLTHTNLEVRASSVCALGEFGPDAASSVPALIQLLKDGQPEIIGLVARTMGSIGPAAKPAIPFLIELLNSENPQVLMFSMEALGRFGEDAKAAIPGLLELARKPDRMWGAINSLSSMGTNAVPGLIELYRDGDHRQQHFWVARAFMKLGTNAVVAVPDVIGDLNDESPGRVALAAMVLSQFGEKAKVALPRLVELTRDEDPQVRLRAAEALWLLDRQTNAVMLVMTMELQTWAKERDALRSRLSDGFGKSRQEIAAGILGEIGPTASDAIPVLKFMSRSTFVEHRDVAAKALASIEAKNP